MKSLKELRSQINEVLKSSDPIEKWIDDFVHSKNPKFASKTKAERIDMAKGAYYGAQKNESAAVSQNSTAEVSMNEDHLVHVNDGSKYDEEPHEKDVEHIMAGVKKHGGEHAGSSDKGVFFKFKSPEHASNFISHVNKCPHKSCDAHMSEGVEYKGIGTDVVDKKKKLNPQPNLTMAKKQVKDFKEAKVYDPFTKKMVPTKPIKVQAGGGATRNGVPVETGPSKYKEKLNKEEVQIDELSKGLVARYANKVAKTTQDNYDKSKDKFQFSSGREDGMKNAVKRLTKEEAEQIDEISKDTLASYIPKAAKSGRIHGQIASDFEQRSKAARTPSKKASNARIAQKYKEKAWKREDSIAKAVGKLTKEEVEQIDEISKKTLANYVNKAAHDAASGAYQGKEYTAQSNQHTAAGDWDASKKKHDMATKEFNRANKRLANIPKATTKMAKEEVELDEAIAKKLPVQHAVDAVTKTFNTKTATRFLSHLKPGTDKHTTWDKVNAALVKQGVQTHHIASIAQKTSHMNEETIEESRGHKVLATFFKNREVAQRAFTGDKQVPKYLEKGIETPEKDAVEKKRMLGMKEGFLSKSEEDDMRNLDAYSFYKKYGRNKTKHRASHATKTSDVEKYTEETVVEGHDDYAAIAKELVKKHGKNVTKAHITDFEGSRDSNKGLDHAEVMHHVKKLSEGDKVYDEKWAQFDSKKNSIKGAK